MSRGSIRRDDKGSWSFVLDVRNGSGGRRQIRRRGFSTKRDAQDALAELVADTNRGAVIAPPKMTL